MAKPELLKQFELRGEALEEKVREYFQGESLETVDEILRDSVVDFEEDKIITGKVVSVSSDWVIVDVGYKAEGEVPLSHFEGAEVNAGDEVDVLIEEVDEIDGRIVSRAGNKSSRLTTKATSLLDVSCVRSRVAC